MANLLILSVGRTLSGFLSAVTAATELGGGRPVAAAGLPFQASGIRTPSSNRPGTASN